MAYERYEKVKFKINFNSFSKSSFISEQKMPYIRETSIQCLSNLISSFNYFSFFKEFDESQDMAGKPIPGFLCRVVTPEREENLDIKNTVPVHISNVVEPEPAKFSCGACPP